MAYRLIAAAGSAMLAACQAVPAPPPPAGNDCPIIDSSAWAAWINALPGPGARRSLIVTGKVTLPTGGYEIGWADFRIAESYPVQIFGELRVIPPAGVAAQAVTTYDVRGEWPIDQAVGSVTIGCGNRALARISPVEIAH